MKRRHLICCGFIAFALICSLPCIPREKNKKDFEVTYEDMPLHCDPNVGRVDGSISYAYRHWSAARLAVKLIELNSQQVFSTVTDKDGHFAFSDLPAGIDYMLAISLRCQNPAFFDDPHRSSYAKGLTRTFSVLPKKIAVVKLTIADCIPQ